MCVKACYNSYHLSKDKFESVFTSAEWSAPTLVSPAEIRALLDSFHLCGREIRCLKMIGTDYGHDSDGIEEVAYQQQRELPEELRQCRSSYGHIPGEILFRRAVQIDEPLLIGFTDNARFEIDTPQEPEFRMSMSCIPWCVSSRYGRSNVTADILFAPCIGRIVTEVEVNTYLATKHPMYGTPFESSPFERELVSNVILWLDNDVGLRIGGWIDYCRVDCVDRNGKALEMRYEELKPALYNWEDLHTDERVGFEADCPELLLGPKAAGLSGYSPLVIYPKGEEKWRAYIRKEDSLLLNWIVAHRSGALSAELSICEYTATEWWEILDEAERLLAIPTFDQFFDELVGWNVYINKNGNFLLGELNDRGVDYWKSREIYPKLLRDLRTWSKLALAGNEIMCVGDPPLGGI